MSGCLFQSVWNVQTKRDPVYGIKDYDLFYFDPTDLSWEAEGAVIQSSLDVLSYVNADILIRNQVRVYLWYEKEFGAPYAVLASSCDGINRFTTPSSMYGVSAAGDGSPDVYAPHGFFRCV